MRLYLRLCATACCLLISVYASKRTFSSLSSSSSSAPDPTSEFEFYEKLRTLHISPGNSRNSRTPQFPIGTSRGTQTQSQQPENIPLLELPDSSSVLSPQPPSSKQVQNPLTQESQLPISSFVGSFNLGSESSTNLGTSEESTGIKTSEEIPLTLSSTIGGSILDQRQGPIPLQTAYIDSIPSLLGRHQESVESSDSDDDHDQQIFNYSLLVIPPTPYGRSFMDGPPNIRFPKFWSFPIKNVNHLPKTLVINAQTAYWLHHIQDLTKSAHTVAIVGEFSGIHPEHPKDSYLERAYDAAKYNESYQWSFAFIAGTESKPNAASCFTVLIEMAANVDIRCTNFPYLNDLFDGEIDPNDWKGSLNGQMPDFPSCNGYMGRRLDPKVVMPFISTWIKGKTIVVHDGLYDILHLTKLLDCLPHYEFADRDYMLKLWMNLWKKLQFKSLYDTKCMCKDAAENGLILLTSNSKDLKLADLAHERTRFPYWPLFPYLARFHVSSTKALATAQLYDQLIKGLYNAEDFRDQIFISEEKF